MKIFIDTAKLEEIEQIYSCGILDGVTTNPSLIKKAVEGQNVDMEDYITKILTTAKYLDVATGGSGTYLFFKVNVVPVDEVNMFVPNPSFKSMSELVAKLSFA